MINFKHYHGYAIWELATALEGGIHIRPYDAHGTINSFLANEKIGIFIKHSSNRISPWSFTFTKDHLAEIEILQEASKEIFICLICGPDGFLSLDKEEFEEIWNRKSSLANLSIQVKRERKGAMYCGREQIEHKKPRGLGNTLLQALAN